MSSITLSYLISLPLLTETITTTTTRTVIEEFSPDKETEEVWDGTKWILVKRKTTQRGTVDVVCTDVQVSPYCCSYSFHINLMFCRFTESINV